MTTHLMDPTSESSPAERQGAPRLQSLQGKTVGLLDISKPRGDVFLDRVAEHLRSRGAKTIRFSKPTFSKNAPPDLRKEIAESCDAVLEALAD